MADLIIFTPTLNAGKLIKNLVRNINSISSRVRVYQYIGDGGSFDNTVEIICKNATYQYETCVLPNKNIPETLNFLAEKALILHGHEIPFTVLNADDQIYPDVLVKHLEIFNEHRKKNKADLLGGKVDVVSDGRNLGHRLSSIDEIQNFMSVNHLGLLAPLSVWERCSFPEDFPNAYDYIWLRDVLRKEYHIAVSNENSIGGAEFGGLSYKKRFAAQREIFTDDLHHRNYMRAARRLLVFLAKEFFKQTMPKKIVDEVIRRFRAKNRSIDNWMP